MDSLFSLQGKRAIITGAADGIGKEMAMLFAKRGAHVFLFDLNSAGVEAGAKEINSALGQNVAVGVACDVTKSAEVQSSFARIAEEGGIDILCNNAGIGHVGNIEVAEEADLDRVVKVNINGLFLCAKAAVKAMVARGKGGVILNTGSCASLNPIQDRIVYATTKGATMTMTTSLATDHVHQGIRCNCICPGRVHTPFVDNFIKKNYPGKEAEMFKQLASYMPQARMLHPREIAALALYLVSDEAKMVTGAAFPIDGGIVGVDHPKKYDTVNEMHPSLAVASSLVSKL